MTTALAHRYGSPPRWAREVALFALALVVYQASRALVIGDAATALANSGRVVGAERALGLFQEASLQGAVLGDRWAVEALNRFYLIGHWTVTPLFFVWLYRRRRRAYRLLRNGFLAGNGIALSVFVAFPVAPPRLTPDLGLVDTLHAVSGVDLHGGMLSGWFNPYAAVPSMHFGYAALIGAGLLVLGRSAAARVAGLAYPALVFVAITATANHYVLDALAGAAVMGLGVLAAALWARRVRPAPATPGTSHRARGSRRRRAGGCAPRGAAPRRAAATGPRSPRARAPRRRPPARSATGCRRRPRAAPTRA